jgi:hypothetical protein
MMVIFKVQVGGDATVEEDLEMNVFRNQSFIKVLIYAGI